MGFNRRTFIAAAGTSAAVAGAAAPAPHQKPVFKRAASSSHYALMAKDQAAITASLTDNRWTAAKGLLATKFAFLSPFTGDLCVDQIVFDETSAAQSQTPPYDPYQLEALASSISTLLDRCLTNRRAMYDLEEQAIRRALEYKLFDDQYDSQKKIELADKVEAQRAAEQTSQQNASTSFGNGTPLNKGFQDLANGGASSAGIAVAAEKERKDCVTSKWTALKTFQDTLQARHVTPGCSLNYTERFGRLEQILRQDVRVAYQKLRCLEKGMNQVLTLGLKLPDPQLNGYLDVMVMFHREAIERAGIATIPEMEFDRVFSFHQRMFANADGSGTARQPYNNEAWAAAVGPKGNGVIELDLSTAFSQAYKTVRVKGVGASVIFAGDNQEHGPLHFKSIPGVVLPPPQPDLFGSTGSKVARPPIPLHGLTWSDPSDLAIKAYPAAGNIDPRIGKWQVYLSPSVLASWGDGDGRQNSVTDVRLHLRLAATIDTANFNLPSAIFDSYW